MAYIHDAADVTILMTANNAPSPNVCAADSEFSAVYAAWKCFDHSGTSYWQTTNTAFPHWIRFDFGSALYVVTEYRVLTFGDASYTPKTWKFQGSDDAVTWVDLDSQTEVTTGWSSTDIRSFPILNTTAYRYYRLYVTAGILANYLSIKEIELFAPIVGDISADAGVKAEMTVLHLSEALASEAGIKALFDGVTKSLIGDVSLPAGVKAEFESLHLIDSFPADSGVKAEFGAAGSEYTRGVQADAGIRADFAGIKMSDTLPGAAGIRMALDRTIEAPRSMAAAAGVLADFEGFNWSDFLRVYRDRISIRYILTLRHAPWPALPEDIDIPISSFQGRFRSGDPSFLSVVVPGNEQYEDIVARAEGDLILTMQYLIGGVVYHSEEICTVDLEDIRIDEGASSVSVSLSGHRTVTHTAKTTRLSGASYKAVYGGKIRYRCTPELYLRPGDTVIVGDDTFTAGVITWMVDPSQQTMEVAEA